MIYTCPNTPSQTNYPMAPIFEIQLYHDKETDLDTTTPKTGAREHQFDATKVPRSLPRVHLANSLQYNRHHTQFWLVDMSFLKVLFSRIQFHWNCCPELRLSVQQKVVETVDCELSCIWTRGGQC